MYKAQLSNFYLDLMYSHIVHSTRIEDAAKQCMNSLFFCKSAIFSTGSGVRGGMHGHFEEPFVVIF